MRDDADIGDEKPDLGTEPEADPGIEAELDEFGRDARGRWPADRARADDFADDIIPEPPRFRADGERVADPELIAATLAGLGTEDEVLAATADLDDDEGADIVPDSAPLGLEVVEGILNAKRPEAQIHPSLERINGLMDLLGNPQRSYPAIQVGGTNGKTSTSRMIDALLSRLGLRTGRFISPHLQSVTERISVDGVPISDARYVEIYADIAPYVDLLDAGSARTGGIALSKFEILTAMALSGFADTPVDVAVLEVGLGGTWDSTTVADAMVAAIGPIGLDHQDYLGEAIADIAGNKAGIIKPGAIAVIGRQVPEAMDVLLRRAVEVDATVARFGAEFTVLERAFAVGGQRLTLRGLGGEYPDVFLPLAGAHQAENAAVALAAVEAFFSAGAQRALDSDAVQDAFASVASPGRLERISTTPTVLIDAAHNVDGARALAATLAEEFSFRRLIGVLAVMRDKDIRGILEALREVLGQVVVTVNSSSRSMPVAELAQQAEEVFGADRVHRADSLAAALALAVDLATEPDDGGFGGDTSTDGADADAAAAGAGVLVTGSVVSAGDARALAGLDPQ